MPRRQLRLEAEREQDAGQTRRTELQIARERPAKFGRQPANRVTGNGSGSGG